MEEKREPPAPHQASAWPDERLAEIPVYKDKIVELLAMGKFYSEIAAMLEMSPRTIGGWKAGDAEFRERCREAEEAFIDQNEAEMIRRATMGHMEPVIYQGRLMMDPRKADPTTGISTVPLTIARKSDALLMFYLKGKRREVYGDKREIENNVRLEPETVRAELRRRIAAINGSSREGEVPSES